MSAGDKTAAVMIREARARDTRWEVWRMMFTYRVVLRVSADWLCSGYRYARRRDAVLRFWTRRGAEAYAAKLNGATS